MDEHREHHDEHGDEDHDEHGEEMPPILDLEQTRIDLEAGFENPFDGIRNVNVRIGYKDYEHIEVEGDEGGTIFATTNPTSTERGDQSKSMQTNAQKNVQGDQSKNSMR